MIKTKNGVRVMSNMKNQHVQGKPRHDRFRYKMWSRILANDDSHTLKLLFCNITKYLIYLNKLQIGPLILRITLHIM